MTPQPLTDLRSRRAAAALAVAWGYPRPVTWAEIVEGRWFSTPDGIGWLVLGCTEGTVHMHGIGRPGAPRVISPELTAAVIEAAREMGARRVYQPLPLQETLAPELDRLLAQAERAPALRELWRRAGWHKADELGPYLEVA